MLLNQLVVRSPTTDAPNVDMTLSPNSPQDLADDAGTVELSGFELALAELNAEKTTEPGVEFIEIHSDPMDKESDETSDKTTTLHAPVKANTDAPVQSFKQPPQTTDTSSEHPEAHKAVPILLSKLQAGNQSATEPERYPPTSNARNQQLWLQSANVPRAIRGLSNGDTLPPKATSTARQIPPGVESHQYPQAQALMNPEAPIEQLSKDMVPTAQRVETDRNEPLRKPLFQPLNVSIPNPPSTQGAARPTRRSTDISQLQASRNPTGLDVIALRTMSLADAPNALLASNQPIREHVPTGRARLRVKPELLSDARALNWPIHSGSTLETAVDTNLQAKGPRAQIRSQDLHAPTTPPLAAHPTVNANSQTGPIPQFAPQMQVQVQVQVQKEDNGSGGKTTMQVSEISLPARTETPQTAQANAAQITSRPEVQAHVMRQIAEAMQNTAARPVDITLSPEELGRVRLAMSHSETGIVVNVIAERAETLELLRKNIQDLGQQFQSLGYQDIAFSFSGGDQKNHQSQQDQTDQPPATGAPTAEVSPTLSTLAITLGTGIDLRL